MNTCQVSVTDAHNTETASGYTGTLTDCSHQRDEIINTQPTSLAVKIGAYLNVSQGNIQPYVNESQVGVIGTKVTVVKVALGGKFSMLCISLLFSSYRQSFY